MKGKDPKNPANRQTYRELTRTVQRGMCQDSVWNIHQQLEIMQAQTDSGIVKQSQNVSHRVLTLSKTIIEWFYMTELTTKKDGKKFANKLNMKSKTYYC